MLSSLLVGGILVNGSRSTASTDKPWGTEGFWKVMETLTGPERGSVRCLHCNEPPLTRDPHPRKAADDVPPVRRARGAGFIARKSGDWDGELPTPYKKLPGAQALRVGGSSRWI